MALARHGHLQQADVFAMQLERDPLLRSTVVSVAIFDRLPDPAVLVDRIERGTRLNPEFRATLKRAPLHLAPLRWAADPDFDMTWHLRRIGVPPPGDLGAALEYARNAGMGAFDHDRPLWEFSLLEGLSGGRAALVMKLHHSLTDGIGGIQQLAAHVMDLQRQPADLGPLPDDTIARRRGRLFDLAGAMAFDAQRALAILIALARWLPGAVAQLRRDPRGVGADALITAQSIARFVRPLTSTLSPVMIERRLRWHYDTMDIPLDGLKAAAQTVKGTLNDGFMAGVTGGLRRYHERHGASVGELRLTMPISVRTEADPAGGNRITLARFEVPVGVEDPAERMRVIGERCRDLRHERAIPHSNRIAGVLNRLPVSITGGMLKHVDFLASNVPGFRDPVFLGGARLEAFYPFGPTLGSSANLTLMSYRETCHLGVNTDAGAVPDPDVFLECLHEGFAEVLAIA